MKTKYQISLNIANCRIRGFTCYHLLPTRNANESNAVTDLYYNDYSNSASNHVIEYATATSDITLLGMKQSNYDSKRSHFYPPLS